MGFFSLILSLCALCLGTDGGRGPGACPFVGGLGSHPGFLVGMEDEAVTLPACFESERIFDDNIPERSLCILQCQDFSFFFESMTRIVLYYGNN